MKKLLLFAAALFCMSGAATAQTETAAEQKNGKDFEMKTIFDGDTDHGFYIGPELKLTNFQDKTGLLVGGRLGWIIDHRFSVGFAGYGLTTRNSIGAVTGDSKAYLQTGYGGLQMEYTVAPSKVVHLSFPVLVGAGGVAYTRNYFDDRNYDPNRDYDDEVLEADAYMVVEPGVNLELNVARFFRIGVGGSYRMISNVNMEKTTDKDMSGLAGNVTLRFGIF